MHRRPGAQFPRAGVRFVEQAERALAHLFQGDEIIVSGWPQQAIVEEGLDVTEHDLAVDVMLDVFVSLIADPDGPHAAIARQGRDDPFVKGGLVADPIDGLDVAAVGGVDDVAQIAQITLQDVYGAQAIERLDHIVGVANQQ